MSADTYKRQLEDDCLAVLMRYDVPLSETQVRDELTYPLSRVQVRAVLQTLVNTKRACQVRGERLSRNTYIASPIKANL